MKPVIIAMTLAAALSVYWIQDQLECWLEPGTDYCVGCTDDCLDPAPDDEQGEPNNEPDHTPNAEGQAYKV